MAGPPEFADVQFPPLLAEKLSAQWPLARAAQYTVLRHFAELLEQRAHVWANEELEAVHRIRVAARRTRTALQTFAGLWPEPKARRFLKRLAAFADSFNAARDLDVMIEHLAAELAGADGQRAAAYGWLLERNRQLRAKEQPRLEKALRDFEREAVPQKFADFFSTNPEDLWPAAGPAADLLVGQPSRLPEPDASETPAPPETLALPEGEESDGAG